MKMRGVLVVVGFGYSGRAIANAALRAGYRVLATVRRPPDLRFDGAIELRDFNDPSPYAIASHIVVTVPPGAEGDPVWVRHAQQLRLMNAHWIGYISTTGVYGDRGGGLVEETSSPAPGVGRSRLRVGAEAAWSSLADQSAVSLFRTGGIYGPGRSILDQLRDGTARSVTKPGHVFSRIHRDDIARAVITAMAHQSGPGRRVFHLVDDEPAEPSRLVIEAAHLLKLNPPPEIPYEVAVQTMSEMARSFWAESRHVSNTATKSALRLDWAYPTYREGLRGILADERAKRVAQ